MQEQTDCLPEEQRIKKGEEERSNFRFEESAQLALNLTRILMNRASLNDFMEAVLPSIAQLFGTERVCLVDFYESQEHFDLLHFEGYPPDSRFSLQRRRGEMEVTRAVICREPFHSNFNPAFLCLPLYFREILEAVIVFEGDKRIEITEARGEIARVVSAFLGLFMSSSRLEVNRKQVVDMSDLRKAREIQMNFLPKSPPDMPTCEFFGFNQSSNLVGGDYFDYFGSADDAVQCILADACGHGMAAALIMSNFRGLVQSELVRRQDPHKLFDLLNRQLYFGEDLIQFLTGVFLHFNPADRTLHYLNAGHYEPIVLSETRQIRTLPGGGPPLGMFRASRYELKETVLEKGDLVTLFTDGLVDAQRDDGKYFGTKGIVESLYRHYELPLENLAAEIVRDVQRFSQSETFDDDLTIFLMRVA